MTNEDFTNSEVPPSRRFTAGKSKTTRVLVVDDDPLITRMVSRILAPEQGFDTVAVNDSRQALKLVLRSPEAARRPFDVIVTDNMFGDIITDLGAMIQGGMGIAAGGNINPESASMFEPIGGSAPKYTGMGIINPLAAIYACQMMLDFLGEPEAAARVEQSITETIGNIKSMNAGEMGYTTSEVGDMVARLVAE